MIKVIIKQLLYAEYDYLNVMKEKWGFLNGHSCTSSLIEELFITLDASEPPPHNYDS